MTYAERFDGKSAMRSFSSTERVAGIGASRGAAGAGNHGIGPRKPRIAGVEPASGKVNDAVTVTGENLGKESVAGFLLSDDKSDYKAALVEQATGKVVFKVPQVKAGDYNVSIQVGNNILIQPVRFKVQE